MFCRSNPRLKKEICFAVVLCAAVSNAGRYYSWELSHLATPELLQKYNVSKEDFDHVLNGSTDMLRSDQDEQDGIIERARTLKRILEDQLDKKLEEKANKDPDYHGIDLD